MMWEADPAIFFCDHCGHRLDLHAIQPARPLPPPGLERQDSEAWRPLPEVRSCAMDGCGCCYSPLPPRAPEAAARMMVGGELSSVEAQALLDLERWEAELRLP